MVSLPFSDHTGFLGDNWDVQREILSTACGQVNDGACKYLEIRPDEPFCWYMPDLNQTAVFYGHKLSLDAGLDTLYKSFHPSCVQRAIRRADREGLTLREGRGEELISDFYRLFLITHRRHGIPPQPISWFRNLVEYLRENIQFRVAFKSGVAIASIVTLTYKKKMLYKYGCSDARHHSSAGMPFLFWRAIQDAKSRGMTELDLGRSDCDNEGLVRFKENWGAQRNTLIYWGYPARLRPKQDRWGFRTARSLCSRLPVATLPLMGRLLYRHMG